ncbi:MAG TPA: TetR/AcrR family transcriptional regulator [Mycobacterium sp.]|jgi:AcrR family transcriptional regulator|nr:TetR/AcrR family transcriptional regulator [Mycobacterium sp.]
MVVLPGGRYAGRSADERRHERRQRLLDAALSMADEEGFSALRVRAVCVRAGLNDRYFYESFSDCDQLLLAIYDQQAALLIEQLSRVIETTARSELGPRIRSVIDAGIDFCLDDPRRRRILEEWQSTAALRDRRDNLVNLLAQMMLDQGRQVLGEHITDDPTYQMAGLTVVNGLLELGATWWRGDLDVSREQLGDFMVAMILTSADIGTRVEHELTRQP